MTVYVVDNEEKIYMALPEDVTRYEFLDCVEDWGKIMEKLDYVNGDYAEILDKTPDEMTLEDLKRMLEAVEFMSILQSIAERMPLHIVAYYWLNKDIEGVEVMDITKKEVKE